MKYIVETLQAFRHVHVVEAENEKEAELYKYIKRPSKCRRAMCMVACSAPSVGKNRDMA
jgi:hypothetical protein